MVIYVLTGYQYQWLLANVVTEIENEYNCIVLIAVSHTTHGEIFWHMHGTQPNMYIVTPSFQVCRVYKTLLHSLQRINKCH